MTRGVRVNCDRFNMTAADAQSQKMDIRSLWAWYTLGLNIYVGLEHLQVCVLTCHLMGRPDIDSWLQIILCNMETWVLFSITFSIK